MAQGYEIINPNDVDDVYAGTDVPGEFRRLGSELDCEELAATLIRVPPHSDFEQGTGHTHERTEELYFITRGTLTMRFDDDIVKVVAPAVVRVSPATARSHRNEGDELVEILAVSVGGRADAHKIDDFWPASADAVQHR